MSSVEGRMDMFDQAMLDSRDAQRVENETTHRLLTEVIKSLGHAQNGPSHPATGIYWAVEQVSNRVEEVSNRVRPFERFSDRAKGAVGAVIALGPVVGVLVWFLAGDKLTHLFHG